MKHEYGSVRGRMKVGEGTSFVAEMKYPGVLPAVPNVDGCDKDRIAKLLAIEAEPEMPAVRDTYAEGKTLGRLATLIPIAESYGQDQIASKLADRIRLRLEHWLRATDDDGKRKSQGLFCYEPRWGVLIGYPASFGSDDQLNDHHFHYGYFLKAAAEVARRDPDWASEQRWGPMLKLVARNIAAVDHGDELFPYLRNFDPYAGHSWASGHAKFGDGNNNESSSEAMNAWAGMILLGEAIGDRKLRDLGIYLYTSELHAIEEYWFDVYGDNRPAEFTPSVVTMVWGGKGVNATWFTAEPEMIHGINWLPITGASLYLGRFPDYTEKNYQALVAERGSTSWKYWSDIVWMYRGLTDPADARKQWEAADSTTPLESGNSPANTYHWLGNLEKLGQVDRTITADTPLYAVFRKVNQRTYAAYNMGSKPVKVRFSDGTQIEAAPKSCSTQMQQQ